MTLRITTYLRVYLKHFYRHGGLNKFTDYRTMYLRLMQDCFQPEIGEHTIIANDRWLQFAWIRNTKKIAWGKRLVLKQVEHYHPDVVIVQNLYRYNGNFINKIKMLGVRKVIGYICSAFPPAFEVKFEPFDLIVTCNNTYYNKLIAAGIKSKIIMHGFNEKTTRNTIYESNTATR